VGPHAIGNCWSLMGTSGHPRRTRTAGHAAFTVPTLDGEAGWGRVQVPRPQLDSPDSAAQAQRVEGLSLGGNRLLEVLLLLGRPKLRFDRVELRLDVVQPVGQVLLGSDGVWTKRGPGTPARRWQRRPASRLADARQTPPAAPTSEPRPVTALVGGALAGSGPGTSPCIDGCPWSPPWGVPQPPACANHAHDGGFLATHATRPTTIQVYGGSHGPMGVARSFRSERL
jgi:hypothetical protein